MNFQQVLENPERMALMLIDLQNDFLHPEGAYGRAGQKAESIALLPGRLKPLADSIRKKGGWIVSTQIHPRSWQSRNSFYPGSFETTPTFFGKGRLCSWVLGASIGQRTSACGPICRKSCIQCFLHESSRVGSSTGWY